MPTEKFIRGSEWRKWDLHIHAPSKFTCCKKDDFMWNILEEKLSIFLTELKSLENISVLWITDYFSLDWYKSVIAHKNDLSNIDLILPNLELRITPETNNAKKINLHIIFNTEILSVDKIERFLYKFEFLQQGTSFTCKYEDLIWLWKKFDSSSSDEKAFEKWLNEFSITYQKFFEILKQQDKEFLDNILIWVSNNSWDWASWIKYLSWVRNIIYEWVDFIFSAQPKDREYFLWKWTDNVEKIITKYNWLKPCIHGSDYHWWKNWKIICEPDLNRFCWIKADPTFEWLKQIIYEPDERVYIWKHKPSENLHKISKIDLNFNDTLEIRKKNNSNDSSKYPFCFSGVEKTLVMSDYFTCFIGWRGSWKSSLLNLIYHKITWKSTSFLDENEIIGFADSQIDVDHSSQDVEFLAQNKIEMFATNYKEFSKAIYIRLHNFPDIQEKAKELENLLKLYDEAIVDIKEEERIIKELDESKKRLTSLQKTIAVVKWEQYQSLQTQLEEKQKELNEHDLSKIRIDELRKQLEAFVTDYATLISSKNTYDIKYNEVTWKISNIYNDLCLEKFEDTKRDRGNLQENIESIQWQMKELLEQQWISEEKLQSLNNAQEQIQKITLQVPLYEKQISEYQTQYHKILGLEFKCTLKLYKYAIQTWINMAQEKLQEIQNVHIGMISFKIWLDEEVVKNDLFRNFLKEFAHYKPERFFEEKARESLFRIDPKTIIDGTTTREILYHSFWNGTYNDFLRDIFQSEVNFTIYKLLACKYFYNLEEYLKIEVLYDARPIESSSFWQRCTVVILIMLLFWNNPIIIDEPEAHLDSSLIADYLVHLIKARKREKQIIFATHNANFVINGDAEQVFI